MKEKKYRNGRRRATPARGSILYSCTLYYYYGVCASLNNRIPNATLKPAKLTKHI